MKKVNLIKGAIGLILVLIITVATVSYGKNQRSKINLKDNTQSTLPTVQDNTSNSKNDKSAQDKTKPTQLETPAPAVNTPVQAQNTQGQMPATGATDSILPVIVLSGLSSAYLISRRRLKELQ